MIVVERKSRESSGKQGTLQLSHLDQRTGEISESAASVGNIGQGDSVIKRKPSLCEEQRMEDVRGKKDLKMKESLLFLDHAYQSAQLKEWITIEWDMGWH